MAMKILVANRGEIALRIVRTATDMGIGCVTVFADDDAGSWRGVFGRESVSLQALGPAAISRGRGSTPSPGKPDATPSTPATAILILRLGWTCAAAN